MVEVANWASCVSVPARIICQVTKDMTMISAGAGVDFSVRVAIEDK